MVRRPHHPPEAVPPPEEEEPKPAETLEEFVGAPAAPVEGSGGTAVAVQPQPQPQLQYDVEKLNSFTTWSSKIKYLASLGMTKSQIAKTLSAIRGKPMLYQHVRNVLEAEKLAQAKKQAG